MPSCTSSSNAAPAHLVEELHSLSQMSTDETETLKCTIKSTRITANAHTNLLLRWWVLGREPAPPRTLCRPRSSQPLLHCSGSPAAHLGPRQHTSWAHTQRTRHDTQNEERHTHATFLPDSPELQPAAAGHSWPAAGRCQCWWVSDQRGKPCGAVCVGRSYTQCGSSPGWWAGGRCCQTHCSRWDRTGTLSTGPPALASCHHTTEGGVAELKGNACQRAPTTAPARQCWQWLWGTGQKM